ncbi:hypothetical protein OUZ56_023140 [Daphnia magna]|uniref:AIG1-type G domain-containing protein n=1 Tax=Daphnia magna TaxID=35525 RepID=A0ABR0AYP2_9CRUS|nr:hypothetical protein OUZ56_023140 [Daphnia magna]
MTEPGLRLSALGRNVRVGDFYNYFTDAVFPSKEEVPDQGKEISHAKQTKFSFFYQQPSKSKSQILGINSHVQRYINEGLPDSPQPWFVHYLNISPKDGDDEEAQVTAIFCVERRTETINCNFVESQMFKYQLRSGGKATHLVGKVVSGAEMICSFHRPLDSKRETKDSAQRNIYLWAKNYFDQILVGQSAIESIPTELDKVSCTIFSSLNDGKPIEKTFLEFSSYLLNDCKFDKDDHPPIWKPIDLSLLLIPEQIEVRDWLDRKNDFASEMERHKLTWAWIEDESRSIFSHSSIDRIPLFKNIMSKFQHVLPAFYDKMYEKIDKKFADKAYEKCHTEDALKKLRDISDFLNGVIDWLANRRDEIEEFSQLTSGTELFAMDLEEIKNHMTKRDQKFAKVFVLKVEYKEDPIIGFMLKEVGDQTSIAKLPVVPIVSHEKVSHPVRGKFEKFAIEAQVSDDSSSGDTSYYIALVQISSTFDDGDIMMYDSSGNLLQQITGVHSPSSPRSVIANDSKPNEHAQMKNTESLVSLGPSTDEETAKDADILCAFPSDSNNTVEDRSRNVTQQLSKTRETKASLKHMPPSATSSEPTDETMSNVEWEVKNLLDRQFSQMSLNDEKSIARSTSIADRKTTSYSQSKKCRSKAEEKQDSRKRDKSACLPLPSQKQTSSQHDDKNDATMDNTNDKHDDESQQSESGNDKNSELPADEEPVLGKDQRIAEILIDEKTQYSKLIRRGPPDIYLLNAMEKSNGHDFKWFDICRPGDALQSPDPKKHKIIILMGATGSGKTTLINGMINYILGVRWNDSFRFKCVRDEENVRSQAYSQTSSVTAYTLHHKKGMTIPYSITIIDTPGYGDTGGVKKDKEITAKIHRFLTQQETQIDEIYAVCFVAASGDSRLTATQRYIIDSVLSIFGKDMKENLRLLVTFADNDDPPVVEACKLANFPATPALDDITYSKFNSAVLYCSNVIQENELSFDELFWDMGQENFHKFFTMLAEMDGRNLTSTREVIQRRQQLEQSLKDIECELEGYLLNIEEIEKNRQKLRKYDHNMETNKNFVQEKTEMRLIEVDCDEGIMAYNCQTCKNTCETHLRYTYFQKRQCEDRSCQCSGSDHEFQFFTWTVVPVRVKTIRNDMKAEFEFNSNQKLKTEELMENCSHDLDIAKVKVISLLEQIGVNASSLDSTALRSNALNPTEYLSLMRSRILEEQPPGYEIRLQTLSDLQHSWNTSAKLSAEKGQSRDSNVTTQPVKSDKASRGRATRLQTSTTGYGALESKPGCYGKNGRVEKPSRSGQTTYTNASGRQVTATTRTKCEISSQTQRNMRGTNHSESASITSSNTQTCGRDDGLRRGFLANQTETAASLIHGTDSQWKHPPGSPKEYYQTSVKTPQSPCSKEGDWQNLDGSIDSATGTSSIVQENTNKCDEPKVISSNFQLDDRDPYSCDDETEHLAKKKKIEKKSESLIASACSSFVSIFKSKK